MRWAPSTTYPQTVMQRWLEPTVSLILVCLRPAIEIWRAQPNQLISMGTSFSFFTLIAARLVQSEQRCSVALLSIVTVATKSCCAGHLTTPPLIIQLLKSALPKCHAVKLSNKLAITLACMCVQKAGQPSVQVTCMQGMVPAPSPVCQPPILLSQLMESTLQSARRSCQQHPLFQSLQRLQHAAVTCIKVPTGIASTGQRPSH
jgi:hypothetical protein